MDDPTLLAGRIAQDSTMFSGNANVSLDERGRFAMPTRYRQLLHERSAGEVVVMVDIASVCLIIYPKPDYDAFAEQVKALDNTDPGISVLQRKVIGMKADGALDGNGRVMVPSELRDYANIDRKAILLGQINRLELWSEPEWEQVKSAWRKTGRKGKKAELAGLGLRI